MAAVSLNQPLWLLTEPRLAIGCHAVHLDRGEAAGRHRPLYAPADAQCGRKQAVGGVTLTSAASSPFRPAQLRAGRGASLLAADRSDTGPGANAPPAQASTRSGDDGVPFARRVGARHSSGPGCRVINLTQHIVAKRTDIFYSSRGTGAPAVNPKA